MTEPHDGLFGPTIVKAYRRYWSDYSLGMVGAFWKLARKHVIEPVSLVDLACGEGTFATRVAERIPRVFGIDQSEAMLHAARVRERERRELRARAGYLLGEYIEWVRADMRYFELPLGVDVVTCWYNSMNYLLEEGDLQRAIRAVAGVLRPGGHFLFDVYTPNGMAAEWDDRTLVAVDADDCFVSSRTRYDADSGRGLVHFTGFLRENDGRYQRFDEIHHNRAYPRSALVELLHRAGLEVIDCLSVPRLKPAEDGDGRIVLVARSGSED